MVGIVLLAAVAVAGCAGVVPAPVTVPTSISPAPIWLETPQMTSPTTGWTLRWIKWGVNDSGLARGRTWTDVTPAPGAALPSLPDVLTPVLLARDGERAWLALCCTGADRPGVARLRLRQHHGLVRLVREPSAGTGAGVHHLPDR
jgi:hypothetical protein